MLLSTVKIKSVFVDFVSELVRKEKLSCDFVICLLIQIFRYSDVE